MLNLKEMFRGTGQGKINYEQETQFLKATMAKRLEQFALFSKISDLKISPQNLILSIMNCILL